MLLDRIDIDEHGPLHRVELGPFSEQLNVVCGPDGSGKTAIARFVRDSLVRRQYPLGMMSSSTGRIVWADRNGMVHCLREKDGTPRGRTTLEFEPRDHQRDDWDALRHSWISGVGDTSDRSRATASITFPETLVDGVITDTAITNVSRVVAACIENGLDNSDTYRDVSIDPSHILSPDGHDLPPGSSHPRSLRAQLGDVEAEIARLRSQPHDYQSLVHRRSQLHARLARRTDLHSATEGHACVDHEGSQHRLTELCERARDLRSRQSELRRWLAAIEERPTDPHAALDPYHRSVDAVRFNTLDPDAQRVARSRELQRVNHDLDVCLAEAAEIRRQLRTEHDQRHPSSADRWTDPEAIRAELRRIDQQLAALSRLDWLQARRRHLTSQLNADRRPAHAVSPLSATASRWLVRLSAGRLRRIDWPQRWLASAADARREFTAGRTGVRIDGRDEFNCSAGDRALAVIAVRMAAGDLLAAKGRQVPLLLETHGAAMEISPRSGTPDWQAFHQDGHLGQSNHPIATALSDYASAGRQVIVLTNHEELSSQIARSGGRTFRIHAQRVVHPHRPIWKPHYAAESYVGPYPHTYGARMAPAAAPRPVVDINRDFDLAWREAYGFDDAPDQSVNPSSSTRTDHATPGTPYRDGYYYADTFTTVANSQRFEFDRDGHWVGSHQPDRTSQATPGSGADLRPEPPSPFFLSVDSPIDQAPSIDAVAAARLRGLSVTHINHLMQQDSNRLADALGLTSVNAATIRRWQAECRLVCRVPQLRGFDARVLVGCGVTDPAQLAAIHPADLLQEVEAFLATEPGQRILLSGSSQELSRITCWIAAANSSPAERAAAVARNESDQYGRPLSGEHLVHPLDGRRYVDGDSDSGRANGKRRNRTGVSPKRRRRAAAETLATDGNERGRTKSRDNRRTTVAGRSQRQRSEAKTAARSDPREEVRSRRRKRTSQAERRDRNLVRFQRDSYDRDASPSPSQHNGDAMLRDAAESWRFYLHRDSPVVDAPAIGSRMAERLEAIEIHTVNDLLAADPDTVAAELDHGRVDSEVVLQWQQQAELVCRVPMLRGHDAQLLVIAEVTTPEELAASDAEELFQRIGPISRSTEGGRVLRGGKLPDRAEVSRWVEYAQHTRELVAA